MEAVLTYVILALRTDLRPVMYTLAGTRECMELALRADLHPVMYNFAADYFVLSMVRQTLFSEISRKRIAAGAALGAVTYVLWNAVTGILPAVFHTAAGICMVAVLLGTVFKIRSPASLVRAAGQLLLCLFLLGGSVYFFCMDSGGTFHPGRSLVVMAFCMTVVCLWQRQKKETDRIRGKIYKVRICRGERQTDCLGLYDSGNLLKSPVSGRGVFVIEMSAAKKLLTEEERKIFLKFYEREEMPWELLAEHLCSGIHLLQYTTVGKEGGVMPGFTAERILVEKDGKILADTRGVLGVSRGKLSSGGFFSVLLPADVFL